MHFLDFLRRPKPWGVKAPSLAGEIRAYRCWVVVETDGHPALRSYYAPLLWPPGEIVRATCMTDHDAFKGMGISHEGESPPAKGCTCGIYAVSSPSHGELLRLLYPPVPAPWQRIPRPTVVGGEVALWGRVRVGQNGWRAEFARPLRLWTEPAPGPPGLLEALALRYELPLGPRPKEGG